MANKIRIRRRASGSPGAPSSLENAELAFNEVDNILYYGKGSGGIGGTATTVEAIAGNGAFVTLSTNQSITGNKTFSGTVIVPAPGANTHAATKKYVDDEIDLAAPIGTENQIVVTGNVISLASNVTVPNNLTVTGDLTVHGNTTTLNTATLIVEDKNIVLANVVTPTDSTADGAGISVLGASTKTLNWVDASDSWTSSENLDLASGKVYKINNTNVLTNNTLGSGVLFTSITSTGVVNTGTWSATIDNTTIDGGTF